MQQSDSRHGPSLKRPLVLALIVVLAATSGCGWFRSKKSVYESSSESRPLELPPDLDMPQANPAMVLPAVAPGRVGNDRVAPSGAPPAGTSEAALVVEEFQIQDQIDSAFRRIGLALDRIEGVEVVSASRLLGSHEVRYQGQGFLIRAQAEGETTRVSAVSTDGRPLTGGAAGQLLGLLRQRLG